MTLTERWPLTTLTLVRDSLLSAYSEPARHYHDRRHLSEVLDRLDELADGGEQFARLEVTLAAWFHDAVYDGRPEPEERSAQLARSALVEVAPGVADEVARLVRVTESHRPEPGDRSAEALVDADLAILAAPAERYDEYVAGVRMEYGFLADADFDSGRRQVLLALRDKPSLFHTSYAIARWEAPARANLTRELRHRNWSL